MLLPRSTLFVVLITFGALLEIRLTSSEESSAPDLEEASPQSAPVAPPSGILSNLTQIQPRGTTEFLPIPPERERIGMAATESVRAEASMLPAGFVSCLDAIPQNTAASSEDGRLGVVPNTASRMACCEICRRFPGTCRSWTRNRGQNQLCFLNANP
eukprot:g436.t1